MLTEVLLCFDGTSAAKVEHRLLETGNKRGTSKIFGQISGVHRNKIRKKKKFISIYNSKKA